MSFLGGLFIERPARGRSTADLIEALRKSGADLEARYSTATQDQKAHDLLTHIIGIERWSQAKLGCVTGEGSTEVGEYDPFRPARDTAWPDLIALLAQTRADTIALLQRIDAMNKMQTMVPHNDFGDLSVRGWARYLNAHANLESRKLRG